MKKKSFNFFNYGTYIGIIIAYIVRVLQINYVFKTIPDMQFVILKTFGINAGWTMGISYPVAYWFAPFDLLYTLIFLTFGFFIGWAVIFYGVKLYRKVMK